jgi:hypothetical protein
MFPFGEFALPGINPGNDGTLFEFHREVPFGNPRI